MTRLLSAIRNDMLVQWRTGLYVIGISAAVLSALALGYLTPAEHLAIAVAAVMLLAVGGSTFLYVGAMQMFERDEGTLRALIASPLNMDEYLGAKIVSLTILAGLEAAVMTGGAMAYIAFKGGEVSLPNLPILALAVVLIGVIFTLMGVIMAARYTSITAYLVPMSAVATVLQLPLFYFMGVFTHWAFLVIPTGAPTMLMLGAFRPLETWELVYALGYSALQLAVVAIWARAAFDRHVAKNA